VDEFDRVLDRQHVPIFVLVQMIDHAASVVLLPETVGPVTSTSPRGFKDNSAKTLGVFNCSSVRILLGSSEHAPAPRFWLKRVDAKARQALDLEREIALQRIFVVLALRVVHDVVDHVVHMFVLERVDIDARTSPCTRIIGGRPAERCRSEACS